MIVSKDESLRIRQARKTQHRILHHPGKPAAFTIGKDYAISVMADRDESELFGYTSTIVATGKTRRRRQSTPKETCRIVITAVTESTLGAMTITEARAEGHRTTFDYYGEWCQRHGHGPHDPRTPVTVLEFRLLRETDDKVRLLHAHSENGYTTDIRTALPDEPEAVDEVTAASYARAAFERDDALRREELERRAQLPLAVRLGLARADAKARHVDITGHELAIERQIQRLEKAATRQPNEEAA